MPDNSRAQRRALAYLLAVPVIAIVYLGAFATRIWAALRPAVAVTLGATVIGSVYAEEAYKRAPATPLKAAAALALAFVLIGHGMAPAPVAAANDPSEAVIAAARDYLGHGYQLGAEGPKQFDCSGFIYRAFLDVGELPRVGGMRLRAVGYMRWFIARGQFTRDVSKAERGDLVVWDRGEHIGIYLGEGKAISALVDPYGVSVHSLKGIHMSVDYFLKVDWRNGDGPGDGDGGNGNGNNPNNGATDPGRGPGNGDSPGSGTDEPDPGDTEPGNEPGNGDNGDGEGNGNGNNAVDPGDNPGNGDSPGSGAETENPENSGSPDDGGSQEPGDNGSQEPEPNQPGAVPNGPRADKQGLTTGTLNVRTAADPNARIVGWLGKNRTVSILEQGNSPAGYLWFKVQTTSGQTGWVFSHWVRQI